MVDFVLSLNRPFGRMGAPSNNDRLDRDLYKHFNMQITNNIADGGGMGIKHGLRYDAVILA